MLSPVNLVTKNSCKKDALLCATHLYRCLLDCIALPECVVTSRVRESSGFIRRGGERLDGFAVGEADRSMHHKWWAGLKWSGGPRR